MAVEMGRFEKAGRWFVGLKPYNSGLTFGQKIGRFFVRTMFVCATVCLPIGALNDINNKQKIDIWSTCTPTRCEIDINGKNTNFLNELNVKVSNESGIKIRIDQKSLKPTRARVFFDLSDAHSGQWDVSVNGFRYEKALDLRAE